MTSARHRDHRARGHHPASSSSRVRRSDSTPTVTSRRRASRDAMMMMMMMMMIGWGRVASHDPSGSSRVMTGDRKPTGTRRGLSAQPASLITGHDSWKQTTVCVYSDADRPHAGHRHHPIPRLCARAGRHNSSSSWLSRCVRARVDERARRGRFALGVSYFFYYRRREDARA